jgi:hypothetical protein
MLLLEVWHACLTGVLHVHITKFFVLSPTAAARLQYGQMLPVALLDAPAGGGLISTETSQILWRCPTCSRCCTRWLNPPLKLLPS